MIGKLAICTWLGNHGFSVKGGKPPHWRTVKEWAQRTGREFFWFTPRDPAKPPCTSHLLLLTWAVTLSGTLRTTPGPQTKRKASRARATAG